MESDRFARRVSVESSLRDLITGRTRSKHEDGVVCDWKSGELSLNFSDIIDVIQRDLGLETEMFVELDHGGVVFQDI